jgi:hypothetical protein
MLAVFVLDVAEDFISIRWERDSSVPTVPGKTVHHYAHLEEYEVRVDQMTRDGLRLDQRAATLCI